MYGTVYVGGVCYWFSSLLRGFSDSPVFLPPQKLTLVSKLQFDLETVDEEPLRGNAIANSHLFFFISIEKIHNIFLFLVSPFSKRRLASAQNG